MVVGGNMDSFEKFNGRILESDQEGKSWKVSLIEEGASSNGYNGYKRYYPGTLLENIVERFEDIPAYMYQAGEDILDHLPEDARKIGQLNLNLIGFYENPRLETIEGKKNIVADLKVHDGAESVRELLKDMWNRGKELGVSIVAEGKVEIGKVKGKKYAVMKDIIPESVDPVTNPATGARFLELKEKEVGNLHFESELGGLVSSFDPDIEEQLGVEINSEADLDVEERQIVLDSLIESVEGVSEVLTSELSFIRDDIGEASEEFLASALSFLNDSLSGETNFTEGKDNEDIISNLKELSGEEDLSSFSEALDQGNVQQFLSMLGLEEKISQKEGNVSEVEERVEALESKVDDIGTTLNKFEDYLKEERMTEKLEESGLPSAAEKRVRKQLKDAEDDIGLTEIEEAIENEEEFFNEIIGDIGSTVSGLGGNEVKENGEEVEEEVKEFFSGKIKH
uniref:Uncharacterized protein n=1 Tax=uncultured organism TaxID=155900 RepID=M1Q1I3_9ZZZZ|nr:hypothetical protein FLSS-17_0010 [uncultured organism]